MVLKKTVWFTCGLGFVLSANQVFATTYTTALFDNSQGELVHLNWNFTNPEASQSGVQLEYQSKNSQDQEDNWQNLNTFSCQENATQTECTLPLEKTTFSPLVQFRFTYEPERNLSVHLDLQEIPEASAGETLTAQEQIVFGPIKNIDHDKQPTQLSWQEINYNSLNQASASAQTQNDLIIQYRAYQKNLGWNNWQGNSQVDKVFPAQNFIATAEAHILETTEIENSDFLFLSYLNYNDSPVFLSYRDQKDTFHFTLPETIKYQLNAPIILADEETEATQAATFAINSLNNLQIGETLVFTEEVNGQLHRAQGEITDIKTSENLITIGAWQGVIPLQGENVCDGHRFCFSPTAQIFKIQDYFIPLAEQTKTVTLSATSAGLLNLSLLELQAETLIEPLCLENSEQLCVLKGLDFNLSFHPDKMQYRFVNLNPENTLLNNIFLHQEVLNSHQEEASPSSTFNRLRHGKIIDSSGISRPYYWH
ncbi:MAG: hypothetical protein Q4G02_01865 [bacterium]|nr:hypothetical protein [bacterium]